VLIAAAHAARPGVLRARSLEHAKFAGAALACVVAFVGALPPGLVHWEEILDGVRYAARTYATSHPGFMSPHPALDGLLTLAWVGVGEGATLATCLWRRGRTSRRCLVPLVALVLGYLGLLGVQSVFVMRNLLHFVPALVLLSSWGIARSLDVARRARWPAISLVAVVCALLFPCGARAVTQVRALSARDTRLLARDWLAAHAKRGERVALANGAGFQLVPLSGLDLRAQRTTFPDLDVLAARGFRWLAHSDASEIRYLRSPERFPEQAAKVRVWREELGRRAVLVKRLARRPLPGWDLPGSTANMYHQPEVRIYRLHPPKPAAATTRVAGPAAPPASSESATKPSVGAAR
jgi:hypothetical protein